MAPENLCSECSQIRDCKAVYRQLAGAEEPCVVTRVLVAFLLPIAVFIASLVVFDYALTRAVSGDEGRIALSFLLAAGVSFICILITRAINSRLAKSKSPRTSEGEVVSKPEAD